MEQNHDKDELLDFQILVLGTASWPLQAPTSGFNIPEDVIKTFDRFQHFYNQKHSGRKLNWLFQLCKGELKTSYLRGMKVQPTFTVSTYQMGILLQYNKDTSYTWENLLEATGLQPEVLLGQLAILVKAKVLLLSGSGAVGDAGTKYDLNMEFKSKKLRINLNMPVKSEQKAEAEDTHKTVEEDRKLLIQVGGAAARRGAGSLRLRSLMLRPQAAIVRIMKTRKALKHVTLMNEVIAQLQTRFKPKVSDIKKSIDILLEKEYIERTESQKDMYSYVAVGLDWRGGARPAELTNREPLSASNGSNSTPPPRFACIEIQFVFGCAWCCCEVSRRGKYGRELGLDTNPSATHDRTRWM